MKTLFSGLVLATCLSISACAATHTESTSKLTPTSAPTATTASAQAPASNNSVTVTAADATREIKLKAGDVLVVRLAGNPTTGYTWSVAEVANGSLTRDGESVYEREAATAGLMGAGGTEVWRFRATRAGKQTLKFDYRRSWEKDTPPAKTVSFNVTVE